MKTKTASQPDKTGRRETDILAGRQAGRHPSLPRVGTRPATIHRCTGTSRYFLPRYEYRILNKLSRYLWYIYICINKHGEALSSISAHTLFSPYGRRFSEQTDLKNPCWAVFGVIFKMVDTTTRRFVVMYRTVSLQLYQDTYRIEEKCIVAGLVGTSELSASLQLWIRKRKCEAYFNHNNKWHHNRYVIPSLTSQRLFLAHLHPGLPVLFRTCSWTETRWRPFGGKTRTWHWACVLCRSKYGGNGFPGKDGMCQWRHYN